MQSNSHLHSESTCAINGTGICLGQRRISAEQIDEKICQPIGWTAAHTGVLTRYFVSERQSAITMGASAAMDALQDANLALDEIDCLICASGTSAQPIPSTASLILHHLAPKAKHGPASFDVNCTCLSFIAALDIASQSIQSGKYRRILIISTEAGSVGLNWSQPESAGLIGDGAAAIVLENRLPANQNASIKNTPKVHHSKLRTYTEGTASAQIRGGGTRQPATQINQSNHSDYLFDMNGPQVIKMAIKHLPEFCKDLFTETGTHWDHFDWVIPHQASQPALTMMRRRLKIPKKKFFMNVQEVGNTIAASIPIALHQGIQSGAIQRGMKILLIGTSAGFCIGATLLTY